MFLVQTKSEKEQKFLEEQFCRQGDYFAIPIQKSAMIEDLIGSVLYEIFDDEHQILKNEKKTHYQTQNNKFENIPLISNLKKFVISVLKMTISLSTLKQIFQQVKKRNNELKDFYSYFLDIDSIIQEQDNPHFFNKPCLNKFNQIGNQQYQNKYGLNNLQSDLNNQSVYNSLYNKLVNKNYQDYNHQTEQSQQQKQIQYDIGTISVNSSICNRQRTSLQLQIQIDSKLQKQHGIFNQNLHKSFQSSHGTDSMSIMDIQDIKDQIAFDRSTNATLYSPSWKNIQDQKRKLVEKLLGKQCNSKKEKQSKQYSDQFLNNLSGKFNPIPSILNDQSFEKRARKETKEDIKKSLIFKDSVLSGTQVQSGETNQRLYNHNIKAMKMHQKYKLGKKVSPNHRNANIKRKLSNGQQDKLQNVFYDFHMTRSQIGFEEVENKKEDAQKMNKKDQQQKGGSILNNIFRFRKPNKQTKIEKQKQKKILNCLIQ